MRGRRLSSPFYFLLRLPMKNLAIIGAGALGQQIAQHVSQQQAYAVVGFFDDTMPTGTVTTHGPVLGSLEAVTASFKKSLFDEVLLAIGYRHLVRRQQLYEELAPTVPFGRFVHPAAYVDASAYIGPGVFISPGCVIELNVRVEANVFLYTSCVLAHDSVICAHTFLAPGVQLASHVRVGQRCFLGIGTTIIENCTLADDVRTGGSTTVLKSLPKGSYVGTPARLLFIPAKDSA